MASTRRQRCLAPPPPFRGVPDEGWAFARTIRVGQWYVGLRSDSAELTELLDEAAGEHLRPGVDAPPHYGLATAGPLPAGMRRGGEDGAPLEPGVLVRGPFGVLERASTPELLAALDAYLGTHVTLPRRPLLALRGVVALVDGWAVLTEPATDDLWVLARLRRSLAGAGVQLAHTFGALVDPETWEVVVPGGLPGSLPGGRVGGPVPLARGGPPEGGGADAAAAATGADVATGADEATVAAGATGVPAGRYPLAGWMLSCAEREGEAAIGPRGSGSGEGARDTAGATGDGAVAVGDSTGDSAGAVGPPASRAAAVALGAAAVVEPNWAGGAQAALEAVVELLAAVPAVVAPGDPDAQLSWLAGTGRAWLESSPVALR